MKKCGTETRVLRSYQEWFVKENEMLGAPSRSLGINIKTAMELPYKPKIINSVPSGK